METLIDYLRFTVKEFPDWKATEKDVIEMMQLKYSDFSEKKGQYGYLKRLEFNNITVYFEGQEDMGILVQLSGQGCRFYENYIPGFIWVDFFRYIRETLKCKISRLDVAIDEFDGLLDIERMKEYIITNRLISRFKDYDPHGRRKIKDNALQSNTLYFGSRDSDCMFRVYDKYLERIAKGLPCDCEQWVRFELELKDDRAGRFIDELLKRENFGNIGYVAVQVINNYMRFVEEIDLLNKSRSVNADWWDAFINGVDKLKLTNGDMENDVESVLRWIERSIASSLKLIDKVYGRRVLNKIIDNAELTEKQKVMLKKYESRRMEVI